MDKKKYYISVQARTIMENQGDAAYELEIEAAPEDLEKLKDIFEEMDNFDRASGIRSMVAVGVSYHSDEYNDGYDYYLKEAYSMIKDLGTEETKQHIEQMNM